MCGFGEVLSFSATFTCFFGGFSALHMRFFAQFCNMIVHFFGVANSLVCVFILSFYSVRIIHETFWEGTTFYVFSVRDVVMFMLYLSCEIGNLFE